MTSGDMFLSCEGAHASSPGKAILLGEHSVVYGHPALAFALRDIQLRISLMQPRERPSPQCWDEAWHVCVRGQSISLPSEQRAKLSRSLNRALQVCGFSRTLEECPPQPIEISSQIPLGAGMGGSAALSTALVRLVGTISARTLDPATTATLANLVDQIFHGTASGLDTAAIAAEGIIEFTRGAGARTLACRDGFWVVLVDSGERAQTCDMVSLIANARKLNPDVDLMLGRLGLLAREGARHLRLCQIPELAERCNEAHAILSGLGVSTPRLDAIALAMRKAGALGAKLTGAGGGGLVLGIFADRPAQSLEQIAPWGETFVTFVGAAAPEAPHVDPSIRFTQA